MIFGIVFKKYLPDRIQELGIILNISTIGMILFLLIWETRSRYLVNFIPVFMINAYIGMNAVSYYIKSKKEGKE